MSCIKTIKEENNMTNESKRKLKKEVFLNTSMIFWIVLLTWIEALLTLNILPNIPEDIYNTCVLYTLIPCLVYTIFVLMSFLTFAPPFINYILFFVFVVFRITNEGFSMKMVLISVITVIGVICSNIIKYREMIAE